MLSIAGLNKTYANNVHALRDVTLDIPKGMYGLLGPNGAGKSTLMRTIATLQLPDAGTIELDATDVVTDPETLRRRLGYLPQEFGVYPRTSPLTFLEKRLLQSGEHEIVIRVAEEPKRVGVDPYNKLIDRNPEDNLKAVSAG